MGPMLTEGIGIAGRHFIFSRPRTTAPPGTADAGRAELPFPATLVRLRILGLKCGYGTHREKWPMGVTRGSPQSERPAASDRRRDDSRPPAPLLIRFSS